MIMRTYNINLNKINNSVELKQLQEDINNSFMERLNEIMINEKAEEISNKSFGYIKESFEGVSGLLIETTKGKSIIAKYVNTIKSSKNLSTLHDIYESIRKAGTNSDIDYFVNNFAENKVVAKTLKEDVKKLGEVLASAYKYLGESADAHLAEENTELDSAIEYIVENKKSARNLAEFSAAIKVLREDINKRENIVSFAPSKNIDGFAENLVKEFNEKYANILNEDEKQIVIELGKSNNPEEIFNKYKEICESKMLKKKDEFENSGDSASAKKVSAIFEQIKSKTYSKESLVEDINNLFEIIGIFD